MTKDQLLEIVKNVFKGESASWNCTVRINSEPPRDILFTEEWLAKNITDTDDNDAAAKIEEELRLVKGLPDSEAWAYDQDTGLLTYAVSETKIIHRFLKNNYH